MIKKHDLAATDGKAHFTHRYTYFTFPVLFERPVGSLCLAEFQHPSSFTISMLTGFSGSYGPVAPWRVSDSLSLM